VRAPLIMNSYHGWTTSFVIENGGARTTNVVVTYRWPNGLNDLQEPNDGAVAPKWGLFLNNGSSQLPSEFNGSGIATSEYDKHQPLAAIVNQHKDTQSRSYEGTDIGAKRLRAPTVHKNANIDTGIIVQNLEGIGTMVYVDYYDQSGAWVAGDSMYVYPRAAYQFYLPSNPNLPGSFDGSAAITSSTRVAVLVNLVDKNQTGDPTRGYVVAIPRVDEIEP